VIAGWVVAEVGRQPYVIYGVLRTADAVSPVRAAEVSVSLVAFMAIYAVVFSVGALYILRLIAAGPNAGSAETAGPRPPGYALAAAPHDLED
jgi:cytochrome d ubiquinol oxidase subunit I